MWIINWVLSKVGAKSALLFLLVSLIINLGQYRVNNVTENQLKNKVAQYKLQLSNLERNLAARKRQIDALSMIIQNEEKKYNELAEIANRREQRRKAWHKEALKWKNQYKQKCGVDDEKCKAWNNSDYRGGG